MSSTLLMTSQKNITKKTPKEDVIKYQVSTIAASLKPIYHYPRPARRNASSLKLLLLIWNDNTIAITLNGDGFV